MEETGYTVGLMRPEWGEGGAQSLTFVVTEDCNLRCKYCYVTHKSKGKVLNLETAKRFIDYLLTSPDIHQSDSVVLDFIGGEPLLEAKLIEDICDYFKVRAYEEGTRWYWKYRINISTNGVNYDSDEVQHLIRKNKGKISIGITIDGTKEKHDLQRVFPDGSGSYDIIHKNLKLWMSQFDASTKVTFASEDLKYLRESIIHLWNEGIYNVSANVVYEDVWREGDDKIFEQQLKELADYIIDHELYNKEYCTLFLDHIGTPYEKEDLNNTSCGAGKMLAISPDGNIYPCMRYYDYSLNHQPGYIIGNLDDGIDFDKARVFLLAMYKYQCDNECLNCPIAKGCEFCQGFSYDESESGTNFQKAKYICKMHKARVRANNYYFAKLYHKTGIKRQNFYWKKELLFVLDDQYTSFCSYSNRSNFDNRMSPALIEEGLKFAEENFMKPVFLHSAQIADEYLKDYQEIEVLHRIPISAYREELPFYDYQIVVDDTSINLLERIPYQSNIIFNLSYENMSKLSDMVTTLWEKTDRINLNLYNLSKTANLGEYQKQLEKCVDRMNEIEKHTGVLKELNVLTDVMFIKEHEGCTAGEDSITLAPDGRFYVCPAFYSNHLASVGDLQVGIKIPNGELYRKDHMPLCEKCTSYQCENCKFINKQCTNEVNVSPAFQCRKAQIEEKTAMRLQKLLDGKYEFANVISEKEYEDPIDIVLNGKTMRGYF